MRSRRALVAALATGTVLAVAGCGSAQNATVGSAGTSPKQAAEAGFTALLDRGQLTATIRFDGDAAALSALAGGGATGSAGAASLAGGSMVLAATSGGGSFRDQPPGHHGALALTVNTAKTPKALQVVVVGTTAYLREDVTALAGQGGDVSTRPNAGDIPPQLTFLKSLADGDWLTLDLSALGAAPGSAAPSTPAAEPDTLSAALAKVFQDDVTVTRAAPDHTLGDHLVLHGNVRTVGADLLTALRGLAGPEAGLLGHLSPTSLPDKTITVDEYVQDGIVSALRVDLAPLLPSGKAAALAVTVSPTATISAPANAVSVDAGPLTSLLGGLLGGTVPSS